MVKGISKQRLLVYVAVLCLVGIAAGIVPLGSMLRDLRREYKLNPEAWSHLPNRRLVGKVMKDAMEVRMEHHSTWNGIRVLQFPSDLMTYQEIITETRPDLIVETGTAWGGLTLFLATVLDSLGEPGRVVTIDIEAQEWRETVAYGQYDRRLLKRIRFLHGSSTAPEIFQTVSEMAQGANVLLILDSLHTSEHVHQELQLYSQLVSPGGYLLVNDTTIGGRYLDESWDLLEVGPLYGVRRFLEESSDFEFAHDRQRFAVSCMHSGILRRVR
jgi:cephalosporin hydroxylase